MLSPRWMGPFKVLACQAPNTYRLDVPATLRVFPEFNVECLRSYLRGPAVPAPPAAAVDPAAPAVQELLKFWMRYGHPHVLVRWAGRDASGDTWELLERLTHCEAALIASEQATGRALPRPAPPLPTAAAPPPPLPPTGFTVDAAPPGDLGAAFVGRQLLFWWPDDDGWQRGTVARICPRGRGAF
jgi:hypothetical protein